MFAEVRGSGPPAVLVHGLGGWSFSWRETWPALAGRYTTHAVDLPGFGPRGLPGQDGAPLPVGARTVGALAEAVRDYILRRGLGSPVVLGHSMGGAVALRLAELAGRAGSGFGVSKLVLIAPAAFPPNGLAFAGAAAAPDAASRARAILRAAYADPEAVTQAQVDGYALGMTEAHMPAFLAHALELGRAGDPPWRFADIKAKTLLVWGAQDPILPPHAAPPPGGPAKALRDGLPDATLVEIPRCGHIPQEEKPAETNAAIAGFL